MNFVKSLLGKGGKLPINPSPYKIKLHKDNIVFMANNRYDNPLLVTLKFDSEVSVKELIVNGSIVKSLNKFEDNSHIELGISDDVKTIFKNLKK